MKFPQDEHRDFKLVRVSFKGRRRKRKRKRKRRKKGMESRSHLGQFYEEERNEDCFYSEEGRRLLARDLKAASESFDKIRSLAEPTTR